VAFRVPTKDSVSRSVVARLAGVVDSARDLATGLGLRPHVVRIVWTRWTGGMRGIGQEVLVKEEVLTPIPKVERLEDVDAEVVEVGRIETGSVVVSKISSRYPESLLRGALIDGESIPPDVAVFWEIENVSTGRRRRFTRASAPAYDAGRLQWVVGLEAAMSGRDDDGELP